MLYWAVVFFVVAIIAAVLGFSSTKQRRGREASHARQRVYRYCPVASNVAPRAMTVEALAVEALKRLAHGLRQPSSRTGNPSQGPTSVPSGRTVSARSEALQRPAPPGRSLTVLQKFVCLFRRRPLTLPLG